MCVVLFFVLLYCMNTKNRFTKETYIPVPKSVYTVPGHSMASNEEMLFQMINEN